MPGASCTRIVEPDPFEDPFTENAQDPPIAIAINVPLSPDAAGVDEVAGGSDFVDFGGGSEVIGGFGGVTYEPLPCFGGGSATATGDGVGEGVSVALVVALTEATGVGVSVAGGAGVVAV